MKVTTVRAEAPIETVVLEMTPREAGVLAALSFHHEAGANYSLRRGSVSNGTGHGSAFFDALPEEIQQMVRDA